MLSYGKIQDFKLGITVNFMVIYLSCSPLNLGMIKFEEYSYECNLNLAESPEKGEMYGAFVALVPFPF